MKKQADFRSSLRKIFLLRSKLKMWVSKSFTPLDILCYEEFPVNYVSLKKRQCKWTQGNLEYMKKYNKDIGKSKMARTAFHTSSVLMYKNNFYAILCLAKSIETKNLVLFKQCAKQFYT